MSGSKVIIADDELWWNRVGVVPRARYHQQKFANTKPYKYHISDGLRKITASADTATVSAMENPKVTTIEKVLQKPSDAAFYKPEHSKQAPTNERQ